MPTFSKIIALSLSLAFAGSCGGGGGGGGGGSGSSNTPTCTGSEILKNKQCEECTAPQYPNADRTACVTSCPQGEIKVADKPACEAIVSCAGAQVHSAASNTCADCPEDQFPNAVRTACVASCPTGEIKPDFKPTCETIASCTDPQVYNPADNTCIQLACGDEEIADTTARPPVCIAKSACHMDTDKFVSVTGNSCISQTACASVSGRVAAASGDCQVCAGETPIRNVHRTQCISIDDCQTASDNAFSVLDDADCITDADCMAMPGRAATIGGVCQACEDSSPIRSADKTQCISIDDCQSASDNTFSVFGNECIRDADCMEIPGHAATIEGACQACEVPSPIRSADKTQCISISDCQSQSDSAFSVLNGAECITDAACIAEDGRVATTDGVCQQCEGAQPLPNMARTMCLADSDNDGISDDDDSCPTGAEGPATITDLSAGTADLDGDGCKNSEDADDDNDAIADESDSCPTGMTGLAASGDSSAEAADADGDGCKNSEDVDDDNDGLIEIATAQELHNIRYNLAGTSYDDEEADSGEGDTGSTAGAPTGATTICTEETSAESGLYLCGYELTGDIDFYGDGDPATTEDNIDLNGNRAGNFNPIGSEQDDDTTRFTAQLEGNEHSIRNLNIDRITGASRVIDHTHDAGFFGSCGSADIRNLTLSAPQIKGLRYVGALCGIMSSTSLSNVHIADGALQGDSSSTFALSIGGLVGYAINSRLTNCSASADVSDGGGGDDSMGGLVGEADDIQITDSSASGNVSNGRVGDDSMGGLVGNATGGQIIGSRASGNVSDGGASWDHMGGLVGHANRVQITDCSASGNVFDGGDDTRNQKSDTMGGLVGTLGNSRLTNCSASGHVFNGRAGGDTMGGLVGRAGSNQIINCSASGNVFDGGLEGDYMGGLVGRSNGSNRITGSRASGNVSDGGDHNDYMGGLMGYATRDRITSSRASGNVSDGGDHNDYMGGLMGYATGGQITGSRASGNVSDGGDHNDYMGGLMGYATGGQITGSRASGNVSDGGAETDEMGGLVGNLLGSSIVRDSLSLGSVCDGALSGTSCAEGSGANNIGVLIGRVHGQDSRSKSEVHHCLALGATSGHGTDDAVGFFGRIANGTQDQLNANFTNNRFDTAASGVTAKAGALPGSLMAANLSGITGSNTAATQSATAYNTTWLAARWLFASSSYPRLLYFDFDPANPTIASPTEDSAIDVCETISSNNNMMNEGEEAIPDCGDVLDASRARQRRHPVAIGSPVTAYDPNFEAVTYSLKTGAPAGYAINSLTGQISYTGSGEDYEMTMTRSMTVIASSIGAGGSVTQVEQAVTIRIVDVAD